jgi:hypothetical protein
MLISGVHPPAKEILDDTNFVQHLYVVKVCGNKYGMWKIITKKLQSLKKVAIVQKSLQISCSNSTTLQKVANAQKSHDCMQVHKIIANPPKSCKCAIRLQINKKSVVCPHLVPSVLREN